MRGGKSGSRRLSGSAGTAPCRRAFGLVFRVVLVAFFVACAWLRRPSAKREGLWCGDSRTTMRKSRTCLCQAHATVPTLLANIILGHVKIQLLSYSRSASWFVSVFIKGRPLRYGYCACIRGIKRGNDTLI